MVEYLNGTKVIQLKDMQPMIIIQPTHCKIIQMKVSKIK